MSISLNSYKPNYLLIESLDGSNTIDLTNSILFVDYYEDILSPCITMTIRLLNVNTLLNSLPIRGGERVAFSISTLFGDLEFNDERTLYVYKVSDINPGSTNELLTLHLVSREALTNETDRCMKKYSGNISTTVEEILENTLSTDRFESSNIERTSNSYSFIGNQKKPFHILTWLGPKSMPVSNGGGTSGDSELAEANGVGGFLFFENKDGFNFKSIDSMVSGTQIGNSSADSSSITKYFFSQIMESGYTDSEYRILNYTFNKNIDLMKALRVGMYANKTYFYDFFNNRLDVFSYTLKDEIQNANTLGSDGEIAVSDEFGDRISRIMFRLSDSGVFSDNTINSTSGRDNADMAKSFSRYNLLFSQSLQMMIPCNIKLKAGDIIYAEFPKINQSDNKDVDQQQSGNYLIKELRHHFEGTQMITSLKLVRDSYGITYT